MGPILIFLPNPLIIHNLRSVVSGLILLYAGLVGALPLLGQPIATVASSLERYSPTAVPPARTQLTMSAARGEYESFQILVRAPAGGLTNVRLAAPNMSGPGGQIIPAANLTLYREHYVYVSEPISTWHINRPL